jgi:hypothetical protein
LVDELLVMFTMARILAWCSAVVLALPPGSCCFVLNVLSAASAPCEAAPVPVHTCCRAPLAPMRTPDNEQHQVPAKPAAACCCQQDAAQPKHPDINPDAFPCVALTPPHGLPAPDGAGFAAEHVGVFTSSVPSRQLLHCVWLC